MHTVKLIYQMATGLLTIANEQRRIVLNGVSRNTLKHIVLCAAQDRADFTIEFV